MNIKKRIYICPDVKSFLIDTDDILDTIGFGSKNTYGDEQLAKPTHSFFFDFEEEDEEDEEENYGTFLNNK